MSEVETKVFEAAHKWLEKEAMLAADDEHRPAATGDGSAHPLIREQVSFSQNSLVFLVIDYLTYRIHSIPDAVMNATFGFLYLTFAFVATIA